MYTHMGFPDVSGVKNPPANAGGTGDTDLIPGLGKSPGEREQIATHSSILAWNIPWTEEPGRLQSMGSQELDATDKYIYIYISIYIYVLFYI